MILWMHWLHWLETTSTAAPLSLPSSTKLWKPNNTFKKQIHLSLSLWMSRSPLNGHVDTARPHAEYRPTDSSTRRFARQTAHFVQCKITENHKTSTRLQWDSTLHPSRMTRCVFMVNHKNTMASLMTVWLKPTSLIGTQISLRLQKKWSWLSKWSAGLLSSHRYITKPRMTRPSAVAPIAALNRCSIDIIGYWFMNDSYVEV